MAAKKRKTRIIKKSTAADETPFAGLSPDVVLDAAAGLGFESEGHLFALNSYENRVYQLGKACVLKFYRPGRWTDAQILEEHAFTSELATGELPVAAPLEIRRKTLFRHAGFRFAVFPWKRGRAPELDAPEARAVLGRTIGRLHRIGSVRPFDHRPRLSVERLGWQARDAVLASGLIPDGLREQYERASGQLLERVQRTFDSVGAVREQRIHGDCHLGNLLWDDHGPVFVDFDDCVTGPGMQDLWMLLSGSPAEQQRQWQDLLAGYQQFADFDFRELLLIEPLRALRMLHHAAWLAQRWNDPAFPRAFPWFAEGRYWEAHIVDLLEQLAAIYAPPLLCS